MIIMEIMETTTAPIWPKLLVFAIIFWIAIFQFIQQKARERREQNRKEWFGRYRNYQKRKQQ